MVIIEGNRVPATHGTSSEMKSRSSFKSSFVPRLFWASQRDHTSCFDRTHFGTNHCFSRCDCCTIAGQYGGKPKFWCYNLPRSLDRDPLFRYLSSITRLFDLKSLGQTIFRQFRSRYVIEEPWFLMVFARWWVYWLDDPGKCELSPES